MSVEKCEVVMFKLDLLALDLIFPWSNSAVYGFGLYAKFIIILLTGQQFFNIIDAFKHKGGKK